MKCDELESYSAHIFEMGCMDQRVYLKSDVDKVIADLKESHKKEVEQLLMEIVRLKQKLENVNELIKTARQMV